MFYQVFYQVAIILALLSLHCYASPIPSDEEDHEQADVLGPSISNTSSEKPSTNELNEMYYLRMLCALYGSCNDDDQHMIDYDDIKRKRLTTNLFPGIPKYGKRAFSSAFAGIPKFG